MTEAGHSRAHLPQPTHFSASTFAATPRRTEMAPKGHTFTQHPQATQSRSSTTAFRRLRCLVSINALPNLMVPLYAPASGRDCDKVTGRPRQTEGGAQKPGRPFRGGPAGTGMFFC